MPKQKVTITPNLATWLVNNQPVGIVIENGRTLKGKLVSVYLSYGEMNTIVEEYERISHD